MVIFQQDNNCKENHFEDLTDIVADSLDVLSDLTRR